MWLQSPRSYVEVMCLRMRHTARLRRDVNTGSVQSRMNLTQYKGLPRWEDTGMTGGSALRFKSPCSHSHQGNHKHVLYSPQCAAAVLSTLHTTPQFPSHPRIKMLFGSPFIYRGSDWEAEMLRNLSTATQLRGLELGLQSSLQPPFQPSSGPPLSNTLPTTPKYFPSFTPSFTPSLPY